MIRVVKVNKLRIPAERAGVVYVGRTFAGWQGHQLANPFKPARINQDEWSGTLAAYWHLVGEEIDKCLDRYRVWLAMRPTVEADLAALYEQTDHARKPLGCWCGNWNPGEPPLACHAYVLAQLLIERFTTEGGA